MRTGIRLSLFSIALILLAACDRSANQVWLPAWLETNSLTVPRAGATAVTYKNFIYVLGGVDGNQFLSSIERANVKEDGDLGEWQVITQMPETRGFFDAVIVGSNLYIVGGGNGANGKNLLRSVYRARIFDDGNIGQWIRESDLLIPRRCVKLFHHDNKIYALGGFGGTLLDTVESVTIEDDGTLSSWVVLDQKLTTPRYVNAVKKHQDKVYVFGGHHQQSGSGLKQTESALLGESNLMWQASDSDLKQGRYGLSAQSEGNYVYAMGGLSGLEYLHSIEKLDVTLGTWQDTTALPQAMANFSSVKAGKFLYVIGGTTRNGYLTSVNYARINENGDLGIYTSAQQAEAYHRNLQATAFTQQAPRFAHTGIVEDVIIADQYTYVFVRENTRRYWLAGPVVKIAKGDQVGFSEGVFMSNFYSKSLQRKFDNMLFVSQLVFIK